MFFNIWNKKDQYENTQLIVVSQKGHLKKVKRHLCVTKIMRCSSTDKIMAGK